MPLMSKLNIEELTLFKGLVALSESSFPKKCAACGKVYQSEKEFIEETERIRGLSGLKPSEDDDGKPIVELFRNCPCGSTLLDFFQERRQADQYREIFGELLDMLCAKGIDKQLGRKTLHKAARGETSKLIEDLGLDSSKLLQ